MSHPSLFCIPCLSFCLLSIFYSYFDLAMCLLVHSFILPHSFLDFLFWSSLIFTRAILQCVKSVQIRSFFWSVFSPAFGLNTGENYKSHKWLSETLSVFFIKPWFWWLSKVFLSIVQKKMSKAFWEANIYDDFAIKGDKIWFISSVHNHDNNVLPWRSSWFYIITYVHYISKEFPLLKLIAFISSLLPTFTKLWV